MADHIYDPEAPDKEPGKELRDQEQKAPSHERQITTPGSKSADKSSAGEKTLSDDQAESGSLYRSGQSTSQDDGDLYREATGSNSGRIRVNLFGNNLRPKHLIMLVLVGGIISTLFAFGGLFSQFKMNGIMSNIDTRTFARLNGSLDARDTSYIRTYMELRLADICPSSGDCSAKDLKLSAPADSDNLIFRSGQVSRGNPIFNWYRSLRSSSFEQDVFNKHGIVLTSESYRSGNQIKFRTSKITFNGKDINGIDISTDPRYGALADAISKGDWTRFSALANSSIFSDFVNSLPSEEFLSNADRRLAVREFVNSNTQPWQVFKRRQLRKDIASKTGTPKWRLFDDTRTKIDQKKINIRNSVIDSITPSDTQTGKFIRCLFGISDCKFSADPSSPQNEVTAGEPAVKDNQNVEPPSGTTGDTQVVDYSKAAELIKQAVGGAFDIVNAGNWASLINSLATVDNAIYKGTMAGQVAVARGIQAMALYQTFETARDQIQTGNAQPDEVNQFMQSIGNFTAAEAWVKVVEGHGTATSLTTTAAAVKYCSSKHQPSENDFAYLCNNTVIGGMNGADSLQKAYADGPGSVLHPILSTYKKYLGWFGDAFNYMFQKLAGPILNQVLAAVSDIPGVKSNLSNAMGWATSKLATMLGAGNMYSSKSADGKTHLVPSGQLANGVIQGAAFTAEASSRDNGAALTNPDSKATAQGNTLGFENAQAASESVFAKYLSPSNPQSLVGSGLFAVSQIKLSSIDNIFTNIGSLFRTIGAALSLPISRPVSAASSDFGYRAAEVAQTDTYDFPSQCFNENPLSMTPAGGTNIQVIFGSKVKASDLTWALVTNSQSWYNYVYSFAQANQQIPGKNETYADEVYNCNLMDNSVRGDLGNLYGYNDDNGYVGNFDNGGTTTSGSSNTTVASGDSQALAQQILSEASSHKVVFSGRFVQSDIEAAAAGKPGSAGVATSSAILKLIATTGQNHTITITAIQSGGTGHCVNSAGQPQSKSACPTDPHYTGDAVDFGAFDGNVLQGRDSGSIALINLAEGVLPSGSGFGQSNCGSIGLQSGFTQFPDSCNHLHVQVPQGTP